jgi:hypothetical protein
VQDSLRALHAAVMAARRASCSLCVATVVAWAMAVASSSILFTAMAVTCCSSSVRLELELVLAPVMGREVAMTGLGGRGWWHTLALGLG